MYPAWRGSWLGERGSLDRRRRSGFFTILKGTRCGQLLRLHGALQPTRQANLVQVCIHLGLVFVFWCGGARAEPTRARPLVRHLPSCAASCSQIVFSVPICWPSKWRHFTQRATSRLVEPLQCGAIGTYNKTKHTQRRNEVDSNPAPCSRGPEFKSRSGDCYREFCGSLSPSR
jgi:hypothetical protein